MAKGCTTGCLSAVIESNTCSCGVNKRIIDHDTILRFQLPLALPVWLAGVRTSVIINIGTAAIASTVGAKTLGSPIIVGLSGFNTAYVLQGAVLVGLLAVATDMAFERLARQVAWQT